MSVNGSRNDLTQPVGSPRDPRSAWSTLTGPSYLGMLLKDRYKIERELGRGGIGVVYLGRDQQLLSRPVVIKVLSEKSDQYPWFKKKFRQEMEALARIDHPGVVGVLDAGEMHDGKLYLVMQFVEGVNLRSALRLEGMNFERVAQLMRQIGQAISAAHAKGVYHRDLKPENIMLQSFGEGEEQIKVIDFGLALIKDSQVASSKDTTSVAGTVVYMAPEQLMGKPLAASDTYALGVIAYEMLTGRRPFNPDSPYQLLEMQRAGVRVKPTALRPSLPEAAETVILKALSFDSRDRYSRPRDFGEELARALTAEVDGFKFFARGVSEPEPLLRSTIVLADSTRINNLPTQPTPLIGREAELLAVEKLFRKKDIRLLTLTGAGGSGKTRLGLQVAEDLIDEFESGACFVSLAPITESNLAASEIARTLGLKETGGSPLTQIVEDYLCDKQMLLLLDNFEQVICATPLVTKLLAACPRLKILVTSRAPLHIRGEQEFPVSPLMVPDFTVLPPIEELTQYPAVALFVERAIAVKPQFVLSGKNAREVVDICTRLDGLPLAIELAAARIKLLSPQAMLSRLETRLRLLTSGAQDLPERQQTMRSAIAWSYDLLDEDEKRLFRRLAVFVGGFTLETAENLCRQTGDLQIDTFEAVSSLADKSLLREEERAESEPRFMMLETIREYGMECLVGSGEADVFRLAHAQLFLSIAEEVEPELKGPSQVAYLERLAEEHDNLRAALSWSKIGAPAEVGLRMAGALYRFWEVRGHLSEGRGWLEGVLSRSRGASPSARAKALKGAGLLARSQGDYGRAGVLLEEGLALYSGLADKVGIASLLNILGLVAYDHGDYERAVLLNEESLAIKRDLGDKLGIAISLTNLGMVAHDQGHYEQAAALYAESLALFREVGDKRSIALSLNNLGGLAQFQGDNKRAMTLFAESLSLFREMRDMRNISILLNNLGDLGRYESHYEEAMKLYAESLMLAKDLGDKVGIAACLLGLANVVCAQGQAERAALLFGAEEALREAIGAPLPPGERLDYDRNVANACAALSKEEFAAAWAEGRAMTLQRAIAYAVEEKPTCQNSSSKTVELEDLDIR